MLREAELQNHDSQFGGKTHESQWFNTVSRAFWVGKVDCLPFRSAFGGFGALGGMRVWF